MRESEIEKMLVDGVRANGGQAYKFVSPGNDGVPDRIVILPGGRIIFVELKTATGRLSPQQIVQIGRIKKLGASTVVIKGLKDLETFFFCIGYKHTADKIRERINRDEQKRRQTKR